MNAQNPRAMMTDDPTQRGDADTRTQAVIEEPSYRTAVSGDEAAILKVFEEVAPEVPTAVFPHTEAMIQRLVKSNHSWVAVDVHGLIVGYALAELIDSETLSLAYLGVSKSARGQHISPSLVSELQKTSGTIVTDVRRDNASSMVERFESLGFARCADDPFSKERTKLRWEKPASS